MEIFKDIEGYEGLYQVSNLGRVKSLNYWRTKKERILKPRYNCSGYLHVTLCIDHIQKNHRIHRLVCNAFLTNPDNKETINHINGIKSDNRLDNLEWATLSENMRHAFNTGLYKGSMLGKLGKDNIQSIPIIQYDLNYNFVYEFSGFNEAQRKTGIPCGNINKCCKGDRKSAGGYIWKYKNEIL